MAPSELRLVKWARSPRERVKRCLVCATKGKGESYERPNPGRP